MSLLSYLLMHNRYANILGIFTILIISWLFSKHRHAINYRLVASGLLMHALIGLVVLRTFIGQSVIAWCAHLFEQLYAVAGEGIGFVFGALGVPQEPWGVVFAIHILPIIIFFGSIMAVLFHWRIIQRIVSGVSSCVQPILQTSGAETLCAIANSFLGQTEAPLLIRNYIGTMTRSEIMLVMISGMGTISGAVLAVFAGMGIPAVHLLTASVMAIPATIVIAKILYPETETPETSGGAVVDKDVPSKNFFDAISLGARDGLHLALNVAAMLITFLSLIGLVNMMLGFSITQVQYFLSVVGLDITLPNLTLQGIFGYILAPFGWLLGLRGDEIFQAGQLIGIKVAVNEMVAYTELVSMQLSDRAVTLLTYVLCGFSNFSCIGIQIGGIGALEPSQRSVLGEMGFRAVFGAMLANLLSAFVVGLLI